MNLENSISVIIPTYDRPEILNDVVNSYIMQKNIRELIIIDDCSKKSYESTLEKIKDLIKNKDIELKYFKNKKNMGAAFCRNIGIQQSKCKYILWGEDDAFLSKNYVEILLEKIKENEIYFGSIYYGIFLGMNNKEKQKLIKKQQESKKEIFNFLSFEGYYRKKSKKILDLPYGHALILVPKKAYRNIEYFENYKINGYREESDAQVQMKKKGYKILYNSDAECYHYPGNLIPKGGQHKHSLLISEFYKIINTFIFLDRHYLFLKKYYNLKHSKIYIKLYYVLEIIFLNIQRLANKIKRRKK